MQIKYNSKYDSKYISIKKGKVTETKSVNDSILFDVSAKGEVLGIEILNSSNFIVSITTVQGRYNTCSITEKPKKLETKPEAIQLNPMNQVTTPLSPYMLNQKSDVQVNRKFEYFPVA